MSDPQTLAEVEARQLIRRLHDAGIWLRFDGDQVKWSTHTEHVLTIADLRALKRLTPALKPLLAALAAVDAAGQDSEGNSA